MIEDVSPQLGVLTISFHIPHAQSLKDKRQVVKSLKDRVRGKFNVSVAEIGDADKWQTAILAFAMVGNDGGYIESTLQNVMLFVESSNNGFVICDHKIEFF